MKAKLIKDSDGYWLDISDDGITKRPLTDFGQLSLKNCEVIANGYDLDELVKERFGETFWHDGDKYFKEGFQKALEILGDKKFSENDMKKACAVGIDIAVKEGENDFKPFEELLESLQQTEWDVEIEMEKEVGTKLHDDGREFFWTDGTKPKLDAYGCLILKRKV